jgi:hypothetical protein
MDCPPKPKNWKETGHDKIQAEVIKNREKLKFINKHILKHGWNWWNHINGKMV